MFDRKILDACTAEEEQAHRLQFLREQLGSMEVAVDRYKVAAFGNLQVVGFPFDLSLVGGLNPFWAWQGGYRRGLRTVPVDVALGGIEDLLDIPIVVPGREINIVDTRPLDEDEKQLIREAVGIVAKKGKGKKVVWVRTEDGCQRSDGVPCPSGNRPHNHLQRKMVIWTLV